MVKRRDGSQSQFDSQPVKVENWPEICACRWSVTYRWKALDEGYNFVLNLTSIKSFHKKLWPFKVPIDPFLRVYRFPTWEYWDKMTFGCIPHG